MRAGTASSAFRVKTGQPPTGKQVRMGLSPQLTLEAAILREGGFENIHAGSSVGELVYVRLSGDNPPGEQRSLELKIRNNDTPQRPDEAADYALEQLEALIRKFETPVVFAEHGKYPAIADVASDFVYARLQKGDDEIKTCYPPKQLDAWAKRLLLWAEGGEPDDLPRVDDAKAKKTPRDVFAYVIHEGKIRAPAGAMELIARVS